MTISIEIFNDVVAILESIVHMEDEVAVAIKTGKQFIEDFKAGNTEAAQKDCDNLTAALGNLEKVFSATTLPAVIDIYQKLKHSLKEHVIVSEKYLLDMEKQLQVKSTKTLLEKQEKFLQK